MATVLLVDDNDRWREAFSELFRTMYHLYVVEAGNLADAVKAAGTLPVDIVVTDKSFDTRRDVLPLLGFMETEKPYVPVIICSGEDGEQAQKELYCHGYVEKGPNDAEKLARLFRKYGILDSVAGEGTA